MCGFFEVLIVNRGYPADRREENPLPERNQLINTLRTLFAVKNRDMALLTVHKIPFLPDYFRSFLRYFLHRALPIARARVVFNIFVKYSTCIASGGRSRIARDITYVFVYVTLMLNDQIEIVKHSARIATMRNENVKPGYQFAIIDDGYDILFNEPGRILISSLLPNVYYKFAAFRTRRREATGPRCRTINSLGLVNGDRANTSMCEGYDRNDTTK